MFNKLRYAWLSYKEKKIVSEAKILLKKSKLLKAKREYNIESKKITTGKLLAFMLFANCTAIEIFTGWTTVESFRLAREIEMSPDLQPLITLIGTVVGEVMGFAIYCAKSAKENTVGGITYDMAMKNYEYENHMSE